MPNRTAIFASAILVASLAGLSFATVSHSAPQAADTCLSRPKGAPPPGGHWYYRVDRATKRHCWYVGDAGAKVVRTSSNSSAVKPAPPPPPQNELAAPASLADARAELLAPQPQAEPSIDIGAAQRMAAVTADSATRESNPNASADGANLLRQAFASRLPDQSGALVSSNPAPANAVSTAQPTSKTAPVAPAIQLATADASAQTRNGSIQMLLFVIVGALAAAGIIGSVIFRFASSRRSYRAEAPDRRRAVWDLPGADRSWPAAHPNTGASARRVELPRELRDADDPNGRVAEFLARLSRNPAT